MPDSKGQSKKLGTRTGVGQVLVMFAASIGVPFERTLKKAGAKPIHRSRGASRQEL